MLYKGTSRGPDREYYLSDGGKLWVPAGRGLFKPSWNDVLKLAVLRVFGLEVVTAPPVIAGGSGFSGGGGGGGADYFVLTMPSGTGITMTPSVTYEINSSGLSSRTNPPRNAIPVPIAATLTAHYLNLHISGTAASTENGVKILACKNGATDTAGGATVAVNGTAPYNKSITETGLSVAFAVADTIQPLVSMPAWTTTPTNNRLTWSSLFTVT